ncbi:vWA domain-containing protein [Arsenicibacter rosenii]|uniref:VWFA domain-containing protein n=1 Tax=Arsenicibacter rosenii TaxID=1750698 RepID=A0A1S2VH23_9BACT|nr:VWA domain-containing protein [Arsenicibacter rosenii]OIN57535.1 hypothetical protein BLX24_18775 [Arsenicibacter rosenii]
MKSDAANITEAIVGFTQFARQNGLNVGIQETQEALHAARIGLLAERIDFQHALRLLFCQSPEERRRFDELYAQFWQLGVTRPIEDKKPVTEPAQVTKKGTGSVVFMGRNRQPGADEEEDGQHVSGANAEERLRKMDFARLTDVEAALLEELARKLFSQMTLRLRRRYKEGRRTGPLHLRRIIRKGLGSGGDMINLFRKSPRPRRQRLIVLLDVSGSMDKYSFFLLRFIVALRENFRQLEAFIFSTTLLRITPAIQHQYLDQLLVTLSQQVDNWSGGTKIGECLQTFNEQFGKRTLNGSPTVVILSDGLDTGPPELLATELEKIRRRSRKVIWLNPLKGSPVYQPLARGMKAALPSVTTFRSAHSLDSLLELEGILAQV